MNRKGIKIKIKNLTKNQFEEIGVFLDMDKMVGKEYIVFGGDEDYVEIQTRYKVTLPIVAVEIIGKADTGNCKKYKEGTEKSKLYWKNHKANKFKKKN